MNSRARLRLIACASASLLALSCAAEVDEAVEVEALEQSLGVSCATRPWVTTRVGNLVITTQAQADAASCIQRLIGSLTIGDSNELTISLPNLRSVLGPVHIVYSSDNEDVPPLDRDVREVSLPALEQILGDLRMDYPGANGGFYGAEIELGLPALTRMIGDVSVNIDNFGANLGGLNVLTRIVGDLDIWVQTGDIAGFGFLDSLEVVTGDVRFVEGHNTFGLLNTLETVYGSLELSGLLFVTGGPDNFESLRTVGGHVVLRDLNLMQAEDDGRLFPMLQWVGGFLDLEEIRLGAWSAPVRDFNIGAVDVRAFGVRLIDTDYEGFAGTSLDLTRFGRIDLRDNPFLCESTAQAFIDEQRDAGFFGLATTSNNGVSAVCP